MNRQQYTDWLDRWLADVRDETLKQIDKGTPLPLCLAFAQHDIYKAWARAIRKDLDAIIPPTLFPLN